MSLAVEQDRVVHFPKRQSVFEFDEEVSRIFPALVE